MPLTTRARAMERAHYTRTLDAPGSWRFSTATMEAIAAECSTMVDDPAVHAPTLFGLPVRLDDSMALGVMDLVSAHPEPYFAEPWIPAAAWEASAQP